MTYGRVNKPRFYVDAINWLANRGGWSKEDEVSIVCEGDSWGVNEDYTKYQLFDLNPFDPCVFDSDTEGENLIIAFDLVRTPKIDFIALLNHNLYTAGSGGSCSVYFQTAESPITAYDSNEAVELNVVIGCAEVGGTEAIDFTAADVDSIATLGSAASNQYAAIVIVPPIGGYDADVSIGAVMIGQQYTLPNSGDMNVKREQQFDGVTVRTTEGGKRYGFARWIAANDGNDYAPFRCDADDHMYRPGGRQAYEISFSYIADTDLFPSDWSDVNTGDESDFSTILWNKVHGPQLPFIFTPDSTSTTVGDYLFARLTSDFQPRKIANNVYDFKIQIEEEL